MLREPPRRPRLAFTLVELLVVIAIVGMLVGLLLPAVQSAREAARFNQCKSHLRNIGLATLQLHDAQNAFPPARLRSRSDYSSDACESSQPSWLVRVLPYLEENAFADQWDLYAPFKTHDAAVREHVPSVYVCPTRRGVHQAVAGGGEYEETVTYPCGCEETETVELISGAVGDYAANHGDYGSGSTAGEKSYWRGGNGTGVIITSRPVCSNFKPAGWLDKIRMKDIVDGTSKTALVGEMNVPAGRLAEAPENGPMYNGKDLAASARIGGPAIGLARGPVDNTVPVIGFGSWHEGVCPFVMTDGAVRIVANDIDTEALGSMCRRNDDQEPDEPEPTFF